MTLRVSRRTESTTARAPRESNTEQTVAPQRGRDRRKITIHHHSRSRFAVEQALAWIDATAPRADSSLTPGS